jgi:hypothetical protein
MSDAKSLQAVADRQAITELIYRYCRSMDRIDAELGYSIWHEDAVADYGEEVYRGSGRGFIDHVCEQHRGTLAHSHQVTNILIELEGDRAASESYVTSVVRFMRADQLQQITTWGRYIDQWSHRSGRWGIEKRVAIRDLDELRAVGAVSHLDRGRRDHSDPSYSVLRRML